MALNLSPRTLTTIVRQDRIELLLPLLIGSGIFFFLLGWPCLNPSSFEWLLSTDRGQTAVAWFFFQRQDLTLPIGLLPNYLWPQGALLAQADGIPLFSLLAKILLTPLKTLVQPFGFWLLLGTILHATFAWILVKSLGVKDRVILTFASILFTISPLIWRRLDHLALTAQWLILWSFIVHIWSHERSSRRLRSLWLWIPVLVIAAGTHPYLLVMIYVLAIFSLFSRTPFWESVLTTVILSIIVVSELAVFGYFLIRPTDVGFGDCSADLLTLFNSNGRYKFLPAINDNNFQYEGRAYLGVGVIALLILGLGIKLRTTLMPEVRVKVRTLTSMWLASSLMFFYALSSKITVAGMPFLDLSALYQPFLFFAETLRSSGRFVWPLHYLILTWSICCVAQYFRGNCARVILLACLALQCYDIIPHTMRSLADYKGAGFASLLLSQKWAELIDQHSHLILVPPDIKRADCSKIYTNGYYMKFAILAAAHNKSINSGQAARMSFSKCDEKLPGLVTSSSEINPLYVVHPLYVDAVREALGGVEKCSMIDEYWVCSST